MTTLFISDLHLEDSRPGITQRFVDLLDRERKLSTLYVLGDLFEAWIGDDDDSALSDTVATALRSVTARGTRCVFVRGNRDFLVGRAYAERCGFEIVDDGRVEDVEGVPTLILHGDTLCTEDTAYLQFRAQVRSAVWQQAFLAKPLQERRAFAAHARAESAKHTRTTDAAIMDVSPTAVVEALRDAQVRRLIHGHTHRPAIHALAVDGEYAERIVLGDWYSGGSALRLDRERMSLLRF